MVTFENGSQSNVRIMVVGVGGAGRNAVNHMIEDGLGERVDFVVCNTDIRSLGRSRADHNLQIGESITHGLGAGGDPDVGKKAAQENINQIKEMLEGADLVFVACGMGGGTGTGAAPVIARCAKEMGKLAVGVATEPFKFEGAKRMKTALKGFDELNDAVDTLVRIPNQRLLEVIDESVTVVEAFRLADGVLRDAVRSISELIHEIGDVNADFADAFSVMHDAGPALMGTGWCDGGAGRAVEAINQAISSPLLSDVGIEGARRILLNVTGGPDLALTEIEEAIAPVYESAHEDVDLIWGLVTNPEMHGKVKVTVIATGFSSARVICDG